MKTNKLKYTIVYRSKENIWGKYNHKLKFAKQKWIKLLSKLDRRRSFFFNRRPRSLKFLSRNRLMTKQKFKSFYGHLSYATLKREYYEIKRTRFFRRGEHLIVSLERRLDVFLFRAGVFPSIFEAKQSIKHNKITVNHKIISNSNYKMNGGDFIQLEQKPFPETVRNLPYSQTNESLSLLIFLRNPQMREIKYPFPVNLTGLIEYLNTK